MGDSQRLQQAVWNLLSNAIKFTPKGGKVQVRLERINSHLEIVVADNGQGIDRRALENVFDRFWQGTGRDSGERGMGLGLSIVKHIVNLHGGTVTAHSDGLGMGSVFVIRLPLPVTTAGLASPARRHPTVTAGRSERARSTSRRDFRARGRRRCGDARGAAGRCSHRSAPASRRWTPSRARSPFSLNRIPTCLFPTLACPAATAIRSSRRFERGKKRPGLPSICRRSR